MKRWARTDPNDIPSGAARAWQGRDGSGVIREWNTVKYSHTWDAMVREVRAYPWLKHMSERTIARLVSSGRGAVLYVTGDGEDWIRFQFGTPKPRCPEGCFEVPLWNPSVISDMSRHPDELLVKNLTTRCSVCGRSMRMGAKFDPWEKQGDDWFRCAWISGDRHAIGMAPGPALCEAHAAAFRPFATLDRALSDTSIEAFMAVMLKRAARLKARASA